MCCFHQNNYSNYILLLGLHIYTYANPTFSANSKILSYITGINLRFWHYQNLKASSRSLNSYCHSRLRNSA